MTAIALISGTIFRGPDQRTTKTGSAFVTLTLKVANGAAFDFWRVAVFDEEVQGEVAELTKGDSVSFVGRLTVEVYRKDGGEPRVSLSLTADRALSLKKLSRRRDEYRNEGAHP